MASVYACDVCSFHRAVVLTVEDGQLTADGTSASPDPGSDALRRRALATTIRPIPRSQEAELIRRGDGVAYPGAPRASVLRDVFDLEEYAVAAVRPEGVVIALLVLDRSAPPLTDDDVATVELFAHLLGTALERTVLRLRLREVSAEVRHMTTSARVLLEEARTAPLAVNGDADGSSARSSRSGASSAALALSPREIEILELMAQGKSNRDIADQLFVSPDTVKANIARLLRKLGATNRAEAVSRWLTMAR